MIVYFLNRFGERKEIGRVSSMKQANRTIYQFLKEHDYHSYYSRFWEENGETWIDVGSHSEFFIITKEEGEDK